MDKKKDPRDFSVPGSSPGNGVTKKRLSREPLATEGEATPGPDDENPFEEIADREQRELAQRQPRDGDFFRDQFSDEPEATFEQDEIEDQIDFDEPDDNLVDFDLDLSLPEF